MSIIVSFVSGDEVVLEHVLQGSLVSDLIERICICKPLPIGLSYAICDGPRVLQHSDKLLDGVTRFSAVAVEGAIKVFGEHVEKYRACTSFKDCGLNADVLRAIDDCNYSEPTAFQQCSMMALLDGRDIVARGLPRAGKTTCFLMNCLHKMNCRDQTCQALILVASEESMIEMKSVFLALGRQLRIKCSALDDQSSLADLRQDAAQVIIGTPGRFVAAIGGVFLDVDSVSTLILDGADDFEDIEAVNLVFATMPDNIQVCISSLYPCLELHRMTQDPVMVSANPRQSCSA